MPLAVAALLGELAVAGRYVVVLVALLALACRWRACRPPTACR